MKAVEEFFGRLDRLDGNPYSGWKDAWDPIPRGPDKRLGRLLESDAKEWSRKFGSLRLSEMPVGRLARHRLDKRGVTTAVPTTLHQLLQRYRNHQCKEPFDHVYALLNLVGHHRLHLEVDYAQTPLALCCRVLQFVHKHEGMHESEMLYFTGKLRKELGLGRISGAESITIA
jgi:hypothetical protein